MIFRLSRIASAQRIIISVLTIFSAFSTLSAQTSPEKTASAVISGRITIKNKGAAGIVVYAYRQNTEQLQSYRGATDQNGNYRITKLPAGTYVVIPVSPAFAVEQGTNDSVVVSDGESVEDLNFSMVPGGVVTGKITDADGRPIIEAEVAVLPTGSYTFDRQLTGVVHTDDRGIYRAFGLRPGKYKVSVGLESYLPPTGRVSYRKTYYPSVTDYEKAKVIDVTEASETKDVDIVVGRPLTTFKVAGRIVDAETGKPLPNINYGLSQDLGSGSRTSVVGRTFSNVNGEFRFDEVLPGKYTVFIAPSGDNEVRGDSASFDVVDHDVTDLVINAGKAASLSGVVVFEGSEESAAAFKRTDLFIHAFVESTHQYFASPAYAVNADGTFRLGGLKEGRIRFALRSRTRNNFKPLDIVRVERDGVPQTSALILKDAEQVTGIRLVVMYLTGAIHGEVKVEGDESLADSQLLLSVNPLDGDHSWYQSSGMNSSPRLDARNRFQIDGLAAGNYEVSLTVWKGGRLDTNRVYKQQVTVADNAVSEVTLTIKAKP